MNCGTCRKGIAPNVGYVLHTFAGKVSSHHMECRPAPAPKPQVWVYLRGYVDAE
ncbi:hypothetical protein [Streptomyces fulvorobeus]|nr:hypothetical protein [Streptomyces fulvorobeus]NYE44263.1 hypothetical protein [Streptomyces fulvorobeus]